MEQLFEPEIPMQQLTLFVKQARKSFWTSLTAIRSCGRFGPDTDVTIDDKSKVTICNHLTRRDIIVWNTPIFSIAKVTHTIPL